MLLYEDDILYELVTVWTTLIRTAMLHIFCFFGIFNMLSALVNGLKIVKTNYLYFIETVRSIIFSAAAFLTFIYFSFL